VLLMSDTSAGPTQTPNIQYCGLTPTYLHNRSVGNNMLSLKRQEVGTNGQGFHKSQVMVKGTGNGDLW
jgi:hypothetical protein